MVYITKADGTQEPFDSRKLDRSLKRSGANDAIRAHIIEHILTGIQDGAPTDKIYEHAFELLTKERINAPTAARYSIKRAVQELGPSGFPFERFVAEVFRSLGYTNVQNGVVMQGNCVTHEVDVVAEHDGKKMGAEVKFHNNLGMKTDVKDALYVRARFDDLREGPEHITEPWLITNTRFTHNAIAYAKCQHLKLLGWDYPRNRGLEVLIDRAQVHPITTLTTISKDTKRQLLEKNIVLCKNLLPELHSLNRFGVSKEDEEDVRYEVTTLCG